MFKNLVKFIISGVFKTGLLLFLLPFYLLCCLELRYSNIPSDSVRLIMSVLLLIFVPLLLIILRDIFWKCISAIVVLLVIIMSWYIMIPASQSRNWAPEYSKTAYSEIEDGILSLHNLRYCRYRTEHDVEPRYELRRYDLKKLNTLDFVSAPKGDSSLFAVNMLSFGFTDGQVLCVSIEPRLEKGESFSFFRGLFKQYELAYVFADERDLIGLYSNVIKTDVHVFPLRRTPDEIRRLLKNLIAQADQLAVHPEFYSSISENSFGSLLFMAAPPLSWKDYLDYRYFCNAKAPALLYERGDIMTKLSYNEALRNFRISEEIPKKGLSSDFSRQIRQERK